MLWSVMMLAAFGQQPAAEFAVGQLSVRVMPSGVLYVAAPGGQQARVSLHLWHADWKYVHQSWVKGARVERVDGRVHISGELTDSDGKAVMHFSETVAPADGRLRLVYELKPAEGVDIRRGPSLQVTIDRNAMAGRRQYVPPGLAARIPARTSAGGREYWLELAPGLAMVIALDQYTAISMQSMGQRYEVRIALPLGPNWTGTAAAVLHSQPMPKRLPGQVTGDSRPLAIGGVEPARAEVPRYGRFEARIDLAATYQNPFDPDEIAVDAHFVAPSGRELVVPCFYMIDFRRTVVGEVEKLEAGEGSWRVRFTPEEVGRYEFWIEARDRGGQVRWRGGRLDVRASDLPGFVRVARRSPRYLELTTGEGVFPIGHNLPTYYVAKYLPERELEKMRSGGENYNRWWMYSRELGLEWEHAPGWYRQTAAWRMDFLLRLAQRLGFWFMLCLDTHQDFRGTNPWEGWPNNPYNAALGGPCKKPSDFFTSPQARAFYKKRLRYLVARYGWSTRILCWELGNEFEGWPGTPPEALRQWHQEMAGYLRAIDPYRHLITTSFWTPAGREEIWRLENIDIVQTHHYANRKVDMARIVAADCHEKFERYRKPHIFGEVGLHYRFTLEPEDTQGIWLHNAIWAALMSGAASTAMSWWHEGYIDRYGLYRVYRGLARFVEGVPLAKYHWRPVKVAEMRWLQEPEIKPGDITVAPLFGWGKPQVTRFEVSPTGDVNDPGQVPSLLQGHGHEDIRTPVTFVVSYPEDGKFVLHVDRVSRSGIVKIYVDGELAAEFDLPCGEGLGKESVWRERWKLWETVYDKDLSVDVPAGRHEIRVENDGGDWVRVAWYRFVGARDYRQPDHLVLGMRCSRMVIAWVRNGDAAWFNVVAGKVKPRPPAAIRLADVRAGRYRVEYWDTWDGNVVRTEDVTTAGDGLTIHVPRLERDIAIKALRLR